MKKFTTPVAMRVTKEQYLRDLKEPLLKMGYTIIGGLVELIDGIIMTNFGGKNSRVNFNGCFNDDKYNIKKYNPKLFLALAAMTDSDIPSYYEYYICLNDSSRGGYSQGKLYQSDQYSSKYTLQTISDNRKSTSNGWGLDNFRKATKEKLIEHFTNNQKSIKMKKNNRFPFKLSSTDATKIINIACNAWKNDLAPKWGPSIVLNKTITISEVEYKIMREACSGPQDRLFDDIFGKDIKDVEFKLGDLVRVISGGFGAYIANGKIGYIVPNASMGHDRNSGNSVLSMNDSLYTIFIPEIQRFYSLCEGFELELIN